ncbi:MAG: DUF620 domain-containing protein, partial [Bryobacteraceae bacterium]
MVSHLKFKPHGVMIMFQAWRAGALAAALAVATGMPVAAQDKLPKADEILDRFVEVTGGRAIYQKIRTELAIGTMEVVGKGVKGMMTLYQAAPNKMYVSIEIEGVGKMEQGTDGDVVWEKNAIQGPRVKSGEERAAALREADIRSRLNWREAFDKAEVTGVESVDGDPCHKVVMTPKEGKPETRFYSRKTGLLVRKDVIAKTPMGEIPAQSYIGEYKLVDGILTPHRITQKVLGQEMQTSLQSIKYNADIPSSRFDLPDEVKALAAGAQK